MIVHLSLLGVPLLALAKMSLTGLEVCGCAIEISRDMY